MVVGVAGRSRSVVIIRWQPLRSTVPQRETFTPQTIMLSHPLNSFFPASFRKLRTTCFSGLMLLTLASAFAQTAAPQYYFSHLAGPLGGAGSLDGIGSMARFRNPVGIAVDRAGSVFVADLLSGTIRKIAADGAVTTLAGTPGVGGSADGMGSAAQFRGPTGVAVDNADNVYVVDSGNYTIRKITADGIVRTLAGRPGVRGSADGAGTAAQFNWPSCLAIDTAGNVYVTDGDSIRKVSPSGLVTTLVGGVSGGLNRLAGFSGIAVDSEGNIYAADTDGNTICKITAGGVVTTLAGDDNSNMGYADGTGSAARFVHPQGVAVDSTGNVYVADWGSSRIRKITPGGVVSTLAGNLVRGSADQTGTAAQFDSPWGVAVDSAGNVYVADSLNNTIRKISSDGRVVTLAGLANVSGSADGTGLVVRFNSPQKIAIDRAGNLYVADEKNNAIRKVTPIGVVSTVAGTAGVSGNADGTGPAAQFNSPDGVAVDGVGNIYVADTYNCTIRKITSGGAVTTLAGTAGVIGRSDGTGPAASFYLPNSLAVDGAGNIYVADTLNATIRKIAAGGVVTTLAGKAGSTGSADGIGTSAQFNYPAGVAVDNAGNVYVADQGNAAIRKVTPAGVVTTLTEKDSAAQMNDPNGITVDSTGTIYVTGYSAIYMVTSGGIVRSIGGTGGDWGWGSPDGIGSAAQFMYPCGVAVDSAGNLYIADSGNNAIRKGQIAGLPVISTQPQSQTVVPGANVQFSVTAGAVPAPTYQWYFNGGIFNGATTNTLSFASARSADAGDYTVVVTNSLGRVTSAKATLTVSAAPVTPPATPAPSSGGGGAIDVRFLLALLALVGARRFAVSRKS
jgi:sugar lactone lactonase YvrE